MLLYPPTQVLDPVPSHVKIKAFDESPSVSCPPFLSTARSTSFPLLSEPQPLTPAQLLSPCKNCLVGAQIATEFSLRLPKADPGMPSTLFDRPLHPSFKLLILSYIVVFTCLSSYLIARSLGAGPFLVICVIPAHSPVHGTVHTVGFVQALERSSSTQEGDES